MFLSWSLWLLGGDGQKRGRKDRKETSQQGRHCSHQGRAQVRTLQFPGEGPGEDAVLLRGGPRGGRCSPQGRAQGRTLLPPSKTRVPPGEQQQEWREGSQPGCILQAKRWAGLKGKEKSRCPSGFGSEEWTRREATF